MADFKLNYAGGREVLEMARGHIERLTVEVTEAAGEDAEGDVITTDRPHGRVSVPAHRQAKDGALTRGAAAAGLEVHPE